MTITIIIIALVLFVNLFIAQPDCSSTKDSGTKCSETDSTVQYRWHWSSENFMCLSFKYNGCGGNANSYLSRDECIKTCQPMDGPACRGNATHPDMDARSCSELTCPANYTCRMGPFSASCCNVDILNDFTCSDGSEILTESGTAETCQDIYCPTEYECIKGTKFARCCSTEKSESSAESLRDEK